MSFLAARGTVTCICRLTESANGLSDAGDRLINAANGDAGDVGPGGEGLGAAGRGFAAVSVCLGGG